MSKTVIYNADGSINSSGDTNAAASGSSTLTYNRMDIGILALIQSFPTGSQVYDFRVPGDSANNTFRYRFPRAGVILGVTLFGTVSATGSGSIYVTRYNALTDDYNDVMQPSDAGNTQTYNTTTFPRTGMRILAPSPIAYKENDAAAMKFVMTGPVNVNLSGFLLVGLNPQ